MGTDVSASRWSGCGWDSKQGSGDGWGWGDGRCALDGSGYSCTNVLAGDEGAGGEGEGGGSFCACGADDGKGDGFTDKCYQTGDQSVARMMNLDLDFVMDLDWGLADGGGTGEGRSRGTGDITGAGWGAGGPVL